MADKRALITLGSSVALVGFILSGPVGFLLVQVLKPQPAWTTVNSFVSNYSSIQTIPYYFGFVLVGGMLMLAAAHYCNLTTENELDKMHILLSVVWTTIFAALVFFNYICQTTFIHHLVKNYKQGYETAILTFSMANPASLSWAIEMWGYAILGVATWLLASFYREKNRPIYFLLIANGIVSILSAALFVFNSQWLLTGFGLAGYMFWNVLMIVLLFLIYTYAKKRET